MSDTSKDREKDGSDDILGIRHGGGRDQYGGSFAGGQSAGGAYANPHSGAQGGEAGGRLGGDSEAGGLDRTGGQSQQGYYGGGQLGDRNLSDAGHNAGSTQGGLDRGDASYAGHASQHSEAGSAEFDRSVAADEHVAGEHAPFGPGKLTSETVGKEREGPEIASDPVERTRQLGSSPKE